MKRNAVLDFLFLRILFSSNHSNWNCFEVVISYYNNKVLPVWGKKKKKRGLLTPKEMPDPLGLLQLCFRFGEITLGSYKRRFPNTTHTTFLYLLFLIKSLSQLSIGFLFLASLSMTPPSQSLPSTSTLSTIVTGPG